MKILFTTLREKSHFFAMIPFIEACQRQGHTIAVAAPPDFAERVGALGVQFLPFGHPGDEALNPIWARLRTATLPEVWRIALGDVFAGPCAGAAIPKLLETIETWKPAIVVRESHEFAALIAAEKAGVPHIRAAICAPGAEAQIAGHVASAVDGHRRAWGLPPDPTGERIRAEGAVTLFPPSYDDAPAPAAGLARFHVARTKAPPLPDWWGGQEEEAPFVYATLGTVTGRIEQMHAAYRMILAALAELPVRALLTTGSELPPAVLAESPPNVHVERFVPQDDVIPHAAAVLCHGGSGTVLGTLAAGVPMVVTPLFADQPHNGGRIAAIGAGLTIPADKISAEALRAAISRVVGEPSFHVRARQLADEIAALPLVDDAPASMRRLM
ncbi:MAG TPA: glycosyltransferase [Polyangia bacterium]|jgi:UDP:flavonoid glycosyltransferase YjiC (YdhE family)